MKQQRGGRGANRAGGTEVGGGRIRNMCWVQVGLLPGIHARVAGVRRCLQTHKPKGSQR